MAMTWKFKSFFNTSQPTLWF